MPVLAPQMESTFAAQPAKVLLHGTGKFRVVPNSYLKKIEEGQVVLSTVHGSDEEMVEAGCVVLVSYNSGNDEIFYELREQLSDIHIFGDARSPRLLETAIREANFTARKIWLNGCGLLSGVSENINRTGGCNEIRCSTPTSEGCRQAGDH